MAFSERPMTNEAAEVPRTQPIENAKQTANSENRLQSVFFGCLIVCFASVAFFNCLTHRKQKEISETENRTLSEFPVTPDSLKGIAPFLVSVESFYDDHFPLRLKMQQVRSFTMYWLLHSSSSPAVVIGKKNWLFYFTENLSKDDAFNEIQLKNWAQLFQNRSDLLATQGIKFLLVIVPEKSTVYPEFLPRSLAKMSRASRFEEIQNYLKQNTNVTSINLLPEFIAQKRANQMFYKTDSHWTDYGASTAANIIAAKMKALSAKSPREKTNLNRYEQTDFSGDLAKMLNLKGLINENVSAIRHDQFFAKEISGRSEVFTSSKIKSVNETSSTKTDRPKIFVLHDSFTLALQPFLSELSSRAKFFWYQTLPLSMVLKYQPDFVIQEMAERNLYTLGALDEYDFGTYPYFKVRQNMAESGQPLKKTIRTKASFGTEENIENIEIKANGKSVNLKISWHTKGGGTLNKLVGVYILENSGKRITSADYPQNPSYVDFEPGSNWSDYLTISVPTDLETKFKVGIVVYKNQKQPLNVTTLDSDWGGHRALFSNPQK